MRISVIIALILLLTGLYLGYVNRYDRMSGDSEPSIQMESGEQTRVSYEEPDWQMNDFFLVDVLNSAFEDYYSGASYAFVNGINHFLKGDMMTQYTAAKGIPAPKIAVYGTGLLLILAKNLLEPMSGRSLLTRKLAPL